MFKITGLDKIKREMNELGKAMEAVDGDLAEVRFNPFDPASIDRAIQTLDATIDEKLSAFSRNSAVQSIAEQLKENGRAAILERAAAARLEGNEAED